MYFPSLEADEQKLWSHLVDLAKTGSTSTTIADAAEQLEWSHETCLSAAYGLNLENLAYISDADSPKISISREGQAYIAALQKAEETPWVCRYCGHIENTKAAMRTHLQACPNKPQSTGTMGL